MSYLCKKINLSYNDQDLFVEVLQVTVGMLSKANIIPTKSNKII